MIQREKAHTPSGWLLGLWTKKKPKFLGLEVSCCRRGVSSYEERAGHLLPPSLTGACLLSSTSTGQHASGPWHSDRCMWQAVAAACGRPLHCRPSLAWPPVRTALSRWGRHAALSRVRHFFYGLCKVISAPGPARSKLVSHTDALIVIAITAGALWRNMLYRSSS